MFLLKFLMEIAREENSFFCRTLVVFANSSELREINVSDKVELNEFRSTPRAC